MMKKIENDEKIDIYMSPRMKQELIEDATRFEAFFNKDGNVIVNNFLSELIAGYYEPYKEERNKLAASIKAELAPYIDKKKAEDIASALTCKLVHRHKSYGDDSDDARISYKPTIKTDWIFTELKDPKAPKIKLSTYLRQMFSSYLSMPMYERERIIFKAKTDKLLEYCQNRTPICFTSSTAPKGMIFHVVPYDLVHGSDEMFNYLIGQTYDEENHRYLTATFRLCRLGTPSKDGSTEKLQKDVKTHLEKMKRCGPQYVINENREDACIQLTESGQKSYASQYLGRPNTTRREYLENGRCNYYFENATRQLYHYFRRFSPKEAIVIFPESLKEDIKAFHNEV